MTRLEALIKGSYGAFSEGCAYVAIGKVKNEHGRRGWTLKVIWPDDDPNDESVMALIKRLFDSDPNAILVNAYQNAWVGFTEEGDICDGGTIRDVARQIKLGYDAGKCRATFADVIAILEKGVAA